MRRSTFHSICHTCTVLSKEAEARLERVLNYDPAMGIVRHADAGYEEAIENHKKFGINMPMMKE